MLWIRLRALAGRRLIWILVGLSIAATISVETPFLLLLTGTSEYQRLVILCLGFGIVIASGVCLFLRRHRIPPDRACLVGLNTAYLANAALCLAVCWNAEGPFSSKSGWFLTMFLVWPMALEVLSISFS